MKKFLSLVLALVMTMSLVTVSAGAKDFTDSSKINYSEAVDVMSAVKVIDGYAEGDFRPTATLTRGAAAKIICNLILGPTTASALVADAAPYKDVPTNHTFAGYIAYCQKTGIISGYADGTFKPANTLTGYAFMKMLLGALGYKAEVEGYTGANWSINVAKQAINAGLKNGLKGEFNGVKAVTREEACLYAFNTLKATMVEYDTTITIGGVTVAGARKDVANTSAKETIKTDDKMQFAEKYFEKLVKSPDNDDFGRPATKWVNDKKDVGTYVDYTLLFTEYTEEVQGKDLYDALGKTIVDKFEMTTYVDGENESSAYNKMVAKNYKDTFATTGNGVLTQVFVDNDNDEVTIVEINTFLAKADADYNAKKDSVTLNIYGANKVGKDVYVKDTDENTTAEVKGEDFAIVETMKEDDFYLVTLADGKVQTIAKPESMSNVEITSFKKEKNYTIGGTTYKRSDAGTYDGLLTAWTDGTITNLKDTTYNVYLDAYGFVIGIEKVDEDDNYVFIAGYDVNGSALSSKNADAFAIFTDGTSKNIEVKMKKAALSWAKNEATDNQWYTYTTDKDGVYTLTAIDRAYSTSASIAQYWNDIDEETIDKKNVSLQIGTSGAKYAYGNSETVYLVAETKAIKGNTNKVAIINGVDSVTTGIKNTSIKTIGAAALDTKLGTNASEYATDGIRTGGVYTLYKPKTGYIVAAVVVGEDSTVSDNLVFTTSKVTREAYDKTADEYTWTVDAIVNGKEVTLTEKGDSLDAMSGVAERTWYKVSYDAKNNVKSMNPITFASTGDYIDYISIFNGLDKKDRDDVSLVHNKLNSSTALSMTGYTLHVDKSLVWDTGIDVAEDCVAVVVEKWASGWKTEVYDGSSNNVKSAINALNTDKNGALADGEVYAVMDNGLATTVVFVDNTEQNDKETGNGGVKNTDVKTVTLDANGNVSLFNNKGVAITTKNVKRDAELYRYAAGQDGFVCAFSGTYVWGDQNPWTLNHGDSYYVVIDGVRSNTVIAK